MMLYLCYDVVSVEFIVVSEVMNGASGDNRGKVNLLNLLVW